MTEEFQDYTMLHYALATQEIKMDSIVKFKVKDYYNIIIGRMSMILGIRFFYVTLHDRLIKYDESQLDWWKVIGEYYEQ